LELDPFVDPVADTMVLLQPTYEASPSNVAVGAFGWLANVTMTSIGIVAEFEPTQKTYPESLVLATALAFQDERPSRLSRTSSARSSRERQQQSHDQVIANW